MPPDGTEPPDEAAASLRAMIEGAEDARPDDNAELARLAALPLLEYERQRKDAAGRLGISRISILDRLAAALRGDGAQETGGRGRPLDLVDIEPWPTPVDGSALLVELADRIRRHVILEPAAADAAALWVVHTHSIEAAYVSPRLAITSPEKRCGKTTLLSVLNGLVRRPLTAANITPATMFRAIEAAGPTLLVDEADTFINGAEELRGVINAGHSHATATVLRTVETRDGHEVRAFAVWGAMALAAIGRLPGTIEDRAIKIALRRRRADEPVQRFRLDRLTDLRPIAQRAARWVADHIEELRVADPPVPAELHDRAADNWRPLLAIADAAGDAWPERARGAALALTLDSADDAETVRTMLLADLRALFAARASDRIASEEVVAQLGLLDDRPWAEYRAGKPITKAQLARLLKPFGISSGTIRLPDGRTPKGYHLASFADAFARYLPLESATTPQAAESMAVPLYVESPQPSARGVCPSPEMLSNSAGCGVVADREPDPDPEDAFAERAAIREYDGGYARAAAERLARAELGIGSADADNAMANRGSVQ